VENEVVDYDYKSQKLEDRKGKIKTRCFKTCLKCGETKPIFQFSTDKRNTNGRTNVCKVCKVIEYLKYYYGDRDRILTVNKKYRDDHRGERTKYFQDYQRDHKEHLKVVGQKWYKKNRTRIKKKRLELKVNLK